MKEETTHYSTADVDLISILKVVHNIYPIGAGSSDGKIFNQRIFKLTPEVTEILERYEILSNQFGTEYSLSMYLDEFASRDELDVSYEFIIKNT